MKGDMLIFKASTQKEKEDEKVEYNRREMSLGKFQRTLRLPEVVDSEKVKNSFKDGGLELKIPKQKPVKKRTIKVESFFIYLWNTDLAKVPIGFVDVCKR